MPVRKNKSLAPTIDPMLDEASWLLSHAEALADYGRQDESLAELARAAICEEQVACLLEADAQDREAGDSSRECRLVPRKARSMGPCGHSVARRPIRRPAWRISHPSRTAENTLSGPGSQGTEPVARTGIA
jgi:hypothetical protein